MEHEENDRVGQRLETSFALAYGIAGGILLGMGMWQLAVFLFSTLAIWLIVAWTRD